MFTSTPECETGTQILLLLPVSLLLLLLLLPLLLLRKGANRKASSHLQQLREKVEQGELLPSHVPGKGS